MRGEDDTQEKRETFLSIPEFHPSSRTPSETLVTWLFTCLFIHFNSNLMYFIEGP